MGAALNQRESVAAQPISPPISDAETFIDFRAQQGAQRADGVLFGPGGLVLMGASASGDFITPPLTVPLASADPFLAVGTIWTTAAHDLGAEVQVSLRGSADGIIWRDWHAASEYLTGTDGTIAADLALLAADTQFVQARLSWSRLYSTADAVIERVRLIFISPGATDPGALATIAQTAQAGAVVPSALVQPPVITRTAWGCPDGQDSPAWTPEPTTVTHLIIHHTVNSNSTTDWPAAVRAIWQFHAISRNWGDIGYNYLIDPNGVMYEGRAGGDDVIGAHFSCINANTMGVAMMGTYTSETPTAAALATLEQLLAWKIDQRGLDPLGMSWHNGGQHVLSTIAGHRDSISSALACGATSCPGNALHAIIPLIRDGVAERVANPPTATGTPTISVTLTETPLPFETPTSTPTVGSSTPTLETAPPT
ncbi:MAG: hypothetical protein GYB67_14975, partial [Chloroflexi bacterium]|nr:hypothetical protein [Chloroflexota bacterium]